MKNLSYRTVQKGRTLPHKRDGYVCELRREKRMKCCVAVVTRPASQPARPEPFAREIHERCVRGEEVEEETRDCNNSTSSPVE